MQTTAPYVGWVDSDDLLAPTALAETVAILNANPKVGLVYTNYQVINAEGTVQGLGSRCQIPYSKERLLVDFMLFHFRLMRRSTYEQVGGVDTAFVRAQDYDLCLKFSEVTEIHHLQQPLYYYRAHAQSVSQQQRVEQIHWAKQAIDGVDAATFNQYRVGADFEKVVVGLQALLARRPFPLEVIWQFIVMKHNQHQLEQARAIAQQLGVKFALKAVSLDMLPERANPEAFLPEDAHYRSTRA